MITLLLMLSTVPGDDLPRFALPPPRLAIACITADCASRSAAGTFRVPRDTAREVTSKDRALRADGSYCSVVGAKRCTSRGRTIFSTDFSE